MREAKALAMPKTNTVDIMMRKRTKVRFGN